MAPLHGRVRRCAFFSDDNDRISALLDLFFCVDRSDQRRLVDLIDLVLNRSTLGSIDNRRQYSQNLFNSNLSIMILDYLIDLFFRFNAIRSTLILVIDPCSMFLI
ncbi:hypothetical protein M6B38_292420 [Iris pallida]|uniref:Uncharacterized protein n=1 Tax=Iris pallida TaxID=29817 RepID=A0AAX6HVB2_IRIPA|nr:hypothetical protein M6B38_292420 [Iris pallida]